VVTSYTASPVISVPQKEKREARKTCLSHSTLALHTNTGF
jgi:hypothetical protein